MQLCGTVHVPGRRPPDHGRAARRRGGRPGGDRGLSRPRRRRPGRQPCLRDPYLRYGTCALAMVPPKCCAAVDMDVGRGEIVAVLGSNGVGKTTLNMALSGIIAVRTGSIPFRRPSHRRALAGADRGCRAGARARGAPRVPQPLGARKPRPRQLSPRAGPTVRRRCTACLPPSPVCASAWANSPERCRAGSSRCWRSAAA